MSAFFLAINQDGSPFSESSAEQMMTSLDVFGLDQRQLSLHDNYAVGYQSHWVVPEEKGEQQPIANGSQGWFLFDGRIDNRKELFQALSMPADSALSDAQLMIKIFHRYGEASVQKVIGPFVFVYFNPRLNQVIALRDALGGRYLVYAECAGTFMLATWEGALCAHPKFDVQLDESKLSHALGFVATPEPLSYIKNVQVVKPGHQLSLGNGRINQVLVYLPDPAKRIHLSDAQEYAAEFRRLLDQSIQRRMRSTANVGVMLSGGLDSVPMAISAAQQNKNLRAFSWSFSKHVELNETEYSSKVCQMFGIEQHLLDCDQLWPCPLSDFDVNPVVPVNTPYAIKHQAMLQCVQQQEVSTLLSGYAGDVLYSGTQNILYELLASGQLASFMQEYRVRLESVNSLLAFVKQYLVKPMLVKNGIYHSVRSNELKVEHLSKFANDQLNSEQHWLSDRASSARRPQQYINSLDHSIGENLAQARYFDALHSVQKCYPFRDRELLEFMLAIPSKQLFFNGQIRPIVKQAYEPEFPAALLQRNDKTSFYSFLQSGLKNEIAYESFLNNDNCLWHRYINDCKFCPDNTTQTPVDLLKWVCAYYQYWLDSNN